VDPRDQLGELLIVAGRRHRDVSQVEVEIEVRVFDPVGAVEVERHLDEAAAVGEELGQALSIVSSIASRNAAPLIPCAS
jgi:hypothetical protein